MLVIGGLVYAGLLPLGIWLAFDATMRGRTAQGSLAWVVALLTIPFAAIPLYFLFGDRRFRGYIRSRKSGNWHKLGQLGQLAASALRPWSERPWTQQQLALTRIAKMPFTSGNSVRLLVDGVQMFPALLEEIRSASEYVLMQFYIFRDDSVGQAVQRELLAARARGVRVYFMYDEIGCYALPGSFLRTLTDAGCCCSGFRSTPRRRKFLRLNFRNHRKIVVVDGRCGFFGGINIGEEYESSSWRDTHLLVRGPSVQCLQLSFLEDWYWAQGGLLELAWSPRDCHGMSEVLIVPSGPADDLESCVLLFLQLASSATRRLWLAAPYFVPDETVSNALILAALRGVDVRVLFPATCDSVLVRHAAISKYEDLLPHGVRMFRYMPRFMHQKIMLCDDVATVGTANLDNRSFRINFEITGVIADAGFAHEVATMLEDDMRSCEELHRDAWNRLSFKARLAARASSLLSPVL